MLSVLLYQLERVLGVQVFFKLRNVCVSIVGSRVSPLCMSKLYGHLVMRFGSFRFLFREDVYGHTVLCLLHACKFASPDGVLLANYVAQVLGHTRRHSTFLLLVKRVLMVLRQVFAFRGVRIQLSGRLNGFGRAQMRRIQVGTVSQQMCVRPCERGYAQAFTSMGTLGVKV